MFINFQKATCRNTQCYELIIGQHWFGISYSTIIAYRGPFGLYRRSNVWGPTTGRHMRELGCRGYQEVSEDKMSDIITRVATMTKL